MTGTPHTDPLKLLFDNSPDAIWLFDVQTGLFVDCNHAALAMMRATEKSQVLQTRPTHFAPEFQPNGRRSEDLEVEMIQHIQSHGSARFDWLAHRLDGELFHVEVVITKVRDGEREMHFIICREITSRKEAENALRESEAKFRLFFEASADGILLVDPVKNIYVDCNSAAVKMMRASSKEQLLGISPGRFSSEKKSDGTQPANRIQQALSAAMREGSQRFDWNCRRLDGEEFPIEFLVTPIQLGNKSQLMVVCRDITERKQADAKIRELNQQLELRIRERTVELVQANEQLKSEIRERRRKEKLLQDSEARARTLVEHAPEAIVVYDSDTGKLVDANENALALFGITRESVLEFAPQDFSPVVQPDGKLSEDAARERLMEALAGGEPVFEWIHRNAKGELIPCEVRLVRYPAEGRNLVRGSITNISERKRAEQALRESEEKFRALFEASSQGVMLHDEKQFLEINPATLRIVGYEAEELLGKHPSVTSAPIQANGESAEILATKYINECMARGTARFEWLARHKTGRNIPVEVFLTRVPMGGRQLIQAVINDISERKQAEAELLKALTREKELSQLKTNFVSTVSHEFRTPLGIIMSSAQILADYFEQLSPEERKEHLLSITRNSRQMARLMEEVLLLSRVDSGKMICESAAMDLSTFFRRLADEMRSATNRQCPIQLKLPDDLVEARADERLLRYIFSNLLSNAVKYSPENALVELSLERDNAQLICRVRDEGIGIPDADREWLFNAFHRGRNVGERPGTGLGLTIVKRCVDLHGGKIKIEGGVGCGTTVTVWLPVFEKI